MMIDPEANEIQKYTNLVYSTFTAIEELLSLPSNQFFEEVSQRLAHLFKADHIVLMLSEGKSKELVIKSEHFTDNDEKQGIVFSGTKLQSVYTTGETLFLFDEQREGVTVGNTPNAAIRNSFVIAAAFPFIGANENLGVLYAAKYSHNFYHNPPYQLAYNNLPLLCSLASAIALCIESVAGGKEMPIEDIHIHSLTTFLGQLRAKHKMSLREVAEKSNGIIEQTWLSKAERKILGEIRQQHSRLIALARVYGVQTEVLLALAGLEVPPTWSDGKVIDNWLLDMLEDRMLVNILYKLSQEPAWARDAIYKTIDIHLDRGTKPLKFEQPEESSAFINQSQGLDEIENQELIDGIIEQIKSVFPLSPGEEFLTRLRIKESGSIKPAIQVLEGAIRLQQKKGKGE
jgi:transcriptional regulator with XRE-family HTH domain